jgi:hypothetical protein
MLCYYAGQGEGRLLVITKGYFFNQYTVYHPWSILSPWKVLFCNGLKFAPQQFNTD